MSATVNELEFTGPGDVSDGWAGVDDELRDACVAAGIEIGFPGGR